MTEKKAKIECARLIQRNNEIFNVLIPGEISNKEKINLCKEAISNTEKIAVLEYVLCYV